VTRHLWGDEGSGEVADWIYVSSEKIHHLVFGLPPGGSFRHSDRYRTIFAADELMYVLSGTLVLANPEIGEVHLVLTGEAAFFRRDTWHHADSFGPDALRVLELFAPPPATGASSAYAQTKPDLGTPRYADDRWLGRWPMALAEQRSGSTIRVLRDPDVLWRLDGSGGAVTGILVSTEHLTAGKVVIPPGGRAGAHVHTGDESLYVVDGTLNVLLPDASPDEGRRWFELGPRDGFYLPEGTRHELRNVTDRPVEALFGVAPSFGAPSEA
jgi:quercetin dioxygenase-like cupin family protein